MYTHKASPEKALILLSGGLDSTTTLAIAKTEYDACYALSFDYGQKHKIELKAAKSIACDYHVVRHLVLPIPFTYLTHSALTDKKIKVPHHKNSDDIPITYVPARNTIFLSYALALAETIKCSHIFIGVNRLDYSGYPDCRPAYIKAYENMANLATKRAILGQKTKIHTPLIEMTKAEIICTGYHLKVDYGKTISCYNADKNGLACAVCDSCIFRKRGFLNAHLPDPTHYQKK